jgi:hypothetical protein
MSLKKQSFDWREAQIIDSNTFVGAIRIKIAKKYFHSIDWTILSSDAYILLHLVRSDWFFVLSFIFI